MQKNELHSVLYQKHTKSNTIRSVLRNRQVFTEHHPLQIYSRQT